jgi:hypothetical protein
MICTAESNIKETCKRKKERLSSAPNIYLVCITPWNIVFLEKPTVKFKKNRYSGGGVQLGPLGTAATDRPIVIMMMEELVE